MKLDDLGRRAAAEVREATRQARFTARAPGSGRPLRARPAVAVGAAAVVLAVGLPLLFVMRPWGREVLEPGTTTTTQAATTTQATTTTASTAEPEKAPAADVDELVERLYAALNDMDDDAFRALSAEGARHAVYFTDGTTGSITTSFAHDDYRLASAGYLSIDVLGEPIKSGYAVAIPVTYTYPEPDGVLTGFDLVVLVPTGHGWLLSGGATFLAAPGLEPDQAATRATIEADFAAFSAGDVEGDLALFGADAMVWDDVTSPDATYRGDALAEFIAESTWFDAEITGELVFSGPFAVVPTRLVASADSSEGISLYWIQNGLIALHAFGQ